MNNVSGRSGGLDNGQAVATVPIELEPCELRRWMRHHRSWVIYLEPDMPSERLALLYRRHAGSRCPSIGVLSEIAAHPNTPAEVLAELSGPRWRAARLALSTNPNLPDTLLAKLLRSRNPDVLEHLVWHPRVSEHVLRRLAGSSKIPSVREAAKRAIASRGLG